MMVTVDCCRQRKGGKKYCVCVCVHCIFSSLSLSTVAYSLHQGSVCNVLEMPHSVREESPFLPSLAPHCLAISLTAVLWLPIRSCSNTPSSSCRERGKKKKNGGQALNPHMKQAQTLSSKVYWKAPGGQERRFVWGTTSPPSALQHGFASVRPCPPVAPK